MRIRTDGDKAFRSDVIDRASDFYGVNKTRSVVFACNDVPELVSACERVLNRSDLTVEQRQEIADEFNGRIRGVEFEVDLEVSVSKGQ